MIAPFHGRLLIRPSNTHRDSKMLPRDGTARILVVPLSGSPTGHEWGIYDTKTGGRILSSEKGRPYPKRPAATERPWFPHAALTMLQRAATEPMVCEPYALTPLRASLS